jgi:hypothetical protein
LYPKPTHHHVIAVTVQAQPRLITTTFTTFTTFATFTPRSMSSKLKTPDIPESLTEVPAAEKQTWTQFLSSIANFRGNIGSLTAPSFIISGTSLTEYSAYWVGSNRTLVLTCRLNILRFLSRSSRARRPRSERSRSSNGLSPPFADNIPPEMNPYLKQDPLHY